jgi:hypothetical protein
MRLMIAIVYVLMRHPLPQLYCFVSLGSWKAIARHLQTISYRQ